MILATIGPTIGPLDPSNAAGSNIKTLLTYIAILFKNILNVSFYFGNVEIKFFYFFAFAIIVGVWIKILRSVG